jgi:YidC/Oxa1 family membrane protein insertase
LVRSNPRRSLRSSEDIQFFVLRDRYFCAIITPVANDCKGFIKNMQNRETELGLSFDINLAPREEKEFVFKVYLGPQESQLLASLNPQWAAIIHYGRFDTISRGLLKVLEFFNKIVGNWGLALIILSIAVYFLLYPLTLKQLRSMKKMQELQPLIEQLRKEYKNNPQRLNKEIMELYRREKVNPLGGCLPFVLQIPIFFALYQGLIRFFPLKGAHFLWIKDLSEPDRLFILPRALPFLGNEVNLLPIFMAGIMFFQQKFTQNPAATTSAAEQQRIMSIIFPFLFGAIFYRMPSGLVLYWTVNTVLMLLNQVWISRQR